LKWLESYLAGRTFSVVINNSQSNRMPVLSGVPQGSILGPLLFILYVNELNTFGGEFGVTIHSYADDMTLYIGLNPNFEFCSAINNIKLMFK